jgi:hypothetical protein
MLGVSLCLPFFTSNSDSRHGKSGRMVEGACGGRRG